ncbi:MAG: helix-turn-helix transcriptional regulator [Oscillospiraceae bacterium]|nr:helix-turn-helix transcriptional regulator [Oscillospiraceae bacterium]
MYSKFVELLQKNKVTPYRVSKATGISQSSLSDWKTGRAKPKADKLLKLADYFGVTVDYFLKEDK